MTELNESLKVNEAAIGADQAEYQCMLKNSFDGMKERLSSFFGGENVRKAMMVATAISGFSSSSNLRKPKAQTATDKSLGHGHPCTSLTPLAVLTAKRILHTLVFSFLYVSLCSNLRCPKCGASCYYSHLLINLYSQNWLLFAQRRCNVHILFC